MMHHARVYRSGLLLLGLLAVVALSVLFWAASAGASDTDKPSNLVATMQDDGISLSWSAPGLDAESVTGYQVTRRMPRKGETELAVYVNNTGSTDTSYFDDDATQAGQRYVYRVHAWRGEALSGRSNYARIDRPEEPTPVPTAAPTPIPTPVPTPIGTPVPPPEPEVNFGQAAYVVAESDDASTQDATENQVEIIVTLSDDPEQTVTIPIERTNQDGATDNDYSGVPENVVFNNGETSGSFTFTATDDSGNDDRESVLLRFGTLPDGVSAGSTNETTVSITDDDAPAGKVTLALSPTTIEESGAGNATTVTASLVTASSVETTIEVSLDPANTTELSDNRTLTVAAGQTASTGVVTITAVDDTEYTGDREVTVSGAATNTVGAEDPADVTLTITEDEVKPVEVEFGSAAYTVAEKDDDSTEDVTENQVEVTVNLSEDPERTVTIPIDRTNQDGATNADYSGVPDSLVFNSGQTEKTITFAATDDSDNDDGESVLLGFGTLPDGVSPGETNETTVSITDDDVPSVTVEFGAATYEATEGGTVSVTVRLNADPERAVTIPIERTNQDGATDDDYSGVPENLVFNSGDDIEKSFTFTATSDELDDDGESVLLGFGTLPDNVSAGTTYESKVSITEDTTTTLDPNTVVTTDDSQAIELSADSLSLTEDGQGSFTLSLRNVDIHALDPVIVQISDDSRYVTTSPSQIEFEEGEEAAEHTVTVSAKEDDNNVEDTVTLTVIAVTTFGINGNLSLSETVAVSVTDTISVPEAIVVEPPAVSTPGSEPKASQQGGIDPRNFNPGEFDPGQLVIIQDQGEAFVVSPTELTIDDEEAGTAEFTVKLATEPAGDVTVDLETFGLPGDTLVYEVSPTELTFTRMNYNSEQTVTITGIAARLNYWWGDYETMVTVSEDGGTYPAPDVEVTLIFKDDELSFDPDDYNWGMTHPGFTSDGSLASLSVVFHRTVAPTAYDSYGYGRYGGNEYGRVVTATPTTPCLTIEFSLASERDDIVAYLVLRRYVANGVRIPSNYQLANPWPRYDRYIDIQPLMGDNGLLYIDRVTRTPSFHECPCDFHDAIYQMRAIFNDGTFGALSSSDFYYDSPYDEWSDTNRPAGEGGSLTLDEVCDDTLSTYSSDACEDICLDSDHALYDYEACKGWGYY